MEKEPEFLTYEQASKLTGLPKGTLYSLVNRKEIPHHRHGPRLIRFSRKELLKWIDKHHIRVSKK